MLDSLFSKDARKVVSWLLVGWAVVGAVVPLVLHGDMSGVNLEHVGAYALGLLVHPGK